MPVMSDVTQMLLRIESGDRLATSELMPVVYEELRRMAAAQMVAERPGHTLETTALVHEAYLRLVDSTNCDSWDSRAHFFSAAAEAMRRILIDMARSKQSQKRGGDWQRIDLEHAQIATPDSGVDLLALNDALEELAEEQPDKAELVKLRYFAGLTIEEVAGAMGLSTATAVRRWRHARAWLADKLAEAESA